MVTVASAALKTGLPDAYGPAHAPLPHRGRPATRATASRRPRPHGQHQAAHQGPGTGESIESARRALRRAPRGGKPLRATPFASSRRANHPPERSKGASSYSCPQPASCETGFHPWVKVQSAGWVNIGSARTQSVHRNGPAQPIIYAAACACPSSWRQIVSKYSLNALERRSAPGSVASPRSMSWIALTVPGR